MDQNPFAIIQDLTADPVILCQAPNEGAKTNSLDLSPDADAECLHGPSEPLMRLGLKHDEQPKRDGR